MSSAFTTDELRGILSTLKTALTNAIVSGGVTSYSLKSGQGETRVEQASIATITAQINIYQGMLNEALEIESGSNFTYLRSLGL